MGKRFFQSYRWVLLSMLVTILVLAAAAGYTIGVVSKNQAVSQIDVNIGSVEAYLQKNENQASQLTEELKEDYISKTRTTAMILSEDASFLTDDRTLEELRVTVNADRISVSDDRGNITASTDPSGEGSTVREECRTTSIQMFCFCWTRIRRPLWQRPPSGNPAGWCRSHFRLPRR